MARKPEQESIFDMFSRLGHELRMPDIDIDAILEHNRKNLEALEKSAKAAAAGASSVLNKQREMVQQALAEVTDAARNLRMPGSPQEVIAKQAEFARRSFEAAVKNAGETAQLMQKSSADSIDILRARIREAVEEIRETYEKRK